MVFGTDINKKRTSSSQENIDDTSLGELNKLSTILACILESGDAQSEGHPPTGHLESILQRGIEESMFLKHTSSNTTNSIMSCTHNSY